MVRMEYHAEGGEKLIRGMVLYEKEETLPNEEVVNYYYVYMPNYQVVKIEDSNSGAILLGIVGYLRIPELMDQLK